MKLRYIVLTGFIAGAALTVHAIADATKSAGPEPHVTGAPGETTCARSGCHSTYSLNSGAGSVNIALDDGGTTYTPGQSYIVTVRVQHPDAKWFGFEATALNTSNKGVGTISVVESSRTQMHSPTSTALKDRMYIEQKTGGLTPNGQGVGEWTFRWTAPATNSGPVTIYAAGVGADKSGNEVGDYVYTSTLTLQPASAGGTGAINEEDLTVSVSPSPASQVLHVRAENRIIRSMQLSDVTGRIVATVDHPGSSPATIPVNTLAGGAYWLRIEFGSGEPVVRRVMIAR